MSILICGSMLVGTASFAAADDSVKYTVSEPDGQGIIYVYNHSVETLGYNKDSGVALIEDDGYDFKDLNQNGVLDPYEDWRLSTGERAANLAGLMAADCDKEGIESIAGLMLYSSHIQPQR